METLYIFNPESDMALACNSPYYVAPATVQRMARELSVLPAWYARAGETVLLDSPERVKLMEEQSPVCLPVQWMTEISPVYNKVLPWGWNLSLIHRLQMAGVGGEAYPSVEQMDGIRRLSGRQSAVQVLRRLHEISAKYSLSFSRRIIGEAFVLTSIREVGEFVHSCHSTLLKAPWSGSGRGIQHASGVLTASLQGWVEHILTTQQAVVGEPLFNKVLDFAMEFFSDAEGKVRFAGYSVFETDKRGSYKENVLAADEYLESKLAAYVPIAMLHQLRECMEKELADVIKGGYQGYLGVDMMICRALEGMEEVYVVHPCVEINLRMNMGIVSRLVYDKYVCGGARGRYVTEYYHTPGEADRVHQEFLHRYPLQLENGKVKSGYLSLTPVDKDTVCQVYIIIHP